MLPDKLAPSGSFVSLGLLLVLTGCTERSNLIELAHSDSTLIVRENYLPEVSDFPLSVCFRTDADATAAERAKVQADVEAAWEGLPRSAIAFNGWGMCANNASTENIRVYLDSSVGGPLYGWSSRHVRLTKGLSGYNTYANIHEFGHALGIQHEQAHPDKPPECSDTDTLESDAIVLTKYDADAVMNYCAGTPRTLTDREKLFAEIAFPSNTSNHLLRATRAYETVQGLLVRSEAALITDWTARGALPEAYSEVRWFLPGETIYDITLPVAEFTSGSTIDYSFIDFRGEYHTGLARSVTVDNAQHTAITVALL